MLSKRPCLHLYIICKPIYTTPENIIKFIMEFFWAKVCTSLLSKAQNCQPLQLVNLAFLFAKESHLRLNVFISQLLLQQSWTRRDTMQTMSLNIRPVTDGQKKGSDTTWRWSLLRKDLAVGPLFSLLISGLRKDGAVHRALLKMPHVTFKQVTSTQIHKDIAVLNSFRNQEELIT